MKVPAKMILLRNTAIAVACALCLPLFASAAEKVSMWVDENGVTHFSNRQFAPEHAEEVTIEKTNAMDVPEPATESASSASSGSGRWSKIDLPPKQNPKGRRPMRESLYTGRKHQQNRHYR